MREQPPVIAILIGLMGLVRLGLAVRGYLVPEALMESLVAPAAALRGRGAATTTSS